MIDKRKDLKSIEKSPFEEEVTPENYFSGAGRGEVLSLLHEAVLNGQDLMVLTGEEGSGKTVICRLLESKASLSCKTVYFPQAVDSFEEVLRTIAQRLGLDVATQTDGGDIGLDSDDITEALLSQAVDLLVIFDEAENLFLATLERIRKMLDRVNGSGARMHMLFSGRKTFLENCDQLSLCDFQDTEQSYFKLNPLSKAETADYLRNCAAQLPGVDDASTVFTDELVTKINDLAKGNFRVINSLGEESVNTPGDDTSFMVLLNNIKEGVYTGQRTPGREIFPLLREKIVAYLPWIGGGAICLLLLFFLFSSGDDGNGVDQKIVQTEESRLVTEEPVDQGKVAEEKLPPAQISEEQTLAEQEVQTRPAEEAAQPDGDQVSESIEKETAEPNGTLEPLETPESTGTVEMIEPAEQTETTDIGRQEMVADVVEKVTERPPQMEALQQPVQEEFKSVPPLHLTQTQKKKNGLSAKTEPKLTKLQSRPEGSKVKVPTASAAVERLYKERVLAGAGWNKREKQNMYTVQLMALTSRDAEKNLKKMLAQVQYRQEAGNFYIFNKTTAPKYIFVFYGEYPSLERARLVQNSLPRFLRDQKPYVLSIKGALAKVNK